MGLIAALHHPPSTYTQHVKYEYFPYIYTPRGADKSLARVGRKQATATEDFEFHTSYL